MEFEASASAGPVAKKKQNKNKAKKKKGNRNQQKESKDEQEGTQTASIEDEFAAFLFLLDMDEEEDNADTEGSKHPTSWAAHQDQEAEMSVNYLTALTTPDQSFIEAEFLRQFRTHVAWKKYLSTAEMRRFKDRVFLLMAKEKEASEASQSQHQQILYGHFLYEELCLQHQYLTTPQVMQYMLWGLYSTLLAQQWSVNIYIYTLSLSSALASSAAASAEVALSHVVLHMSPS